MQRRLFVKNGELVYDDPVLKMIISKETKLLGGIVDVITKLAAPAFEVRSPTRFMRYPELVRFEGEEDVSINEDFVTSPYSRSKFYIIPAWNRIFHGRPAACNS